MTGVGHVCDRRRLHESTSAFIFVGTGEISWAIDSARGAPGCLFSEGNGGRGAGSFRHWQTMAVSVGSLASF